MRKDAPMDALEVQIRKITRSNDSKMQDVLVEMARESHADVFEQLARHSADGVLTATAIVQAVDPLAAPYGEKPQWRTIAHGLTLAYLADNAALMYVIYDEHVRIVSVQNGNTLAELG